MRYNTIDVENVFLTQIMNKDRSISNSPGMDYQFTLMSYPRTPFCPRRKIYSLNILQKSRFIYSVIIAPDSLNTFIKFLGSIG
jgi:hypothetical protein